MLRNPIHLLRGHLSRMFVFLKAQPKECISNGGISGLREGRAGLSPSVGRWGGRHARTQPFMACRRQGVWGCGRVGGGGSLVSASRPQPGLVPGGSRLPEACETQGALRGRSKCESGKSPSPSAGQVHLPSRGGLHPRPPGLPCPPLCPCLSLGRTNRAKGALGLNPRATRTRPRWVLRPKKVPLAMDHRRQTIPLLPLPV